MCACYVPDPTPNLTSLEESDAPLWHVLYVIFKNEKKIASQLAHKRIPTYLPLRTEMRRWSDRRVTILAPLFPGYLFALCSVAQRTAILQTRGVVRFVKAGTTPAVIPAQEFARLVQLLDHSSAQPHGYLEPGKRVCLTGGLFDGFEGTYIREKGKLRAIVALEWLQKSVIVDVDACDLRQAQDAHI